jgi:hypothetical protein
MLFLGRACLYLLECWNRSEKKKKMKERNECDHVAITKNTNYLSAITRFTLKGLVKLQLESSMTLGKSLIGIALRSLQSAFST